MISKSRRTTNVRDEAKRLRDAGFTPIPMRGKQPDGAWAHLVDTHPSDEQLREWFLPRGVGLGIVCGSSHAVRDFDGAGAYPAWREAYPHIAAELATVRTGRPDGHHVHCRVHPSAIEAIRRSLGSDGTGSLKFADGELRVGAAAVVMPPSKHIQTRRPYEYLGQQLDADLPEINPADIGWIPKSDTQQDTAFSAYPAGLKPCLVSAVCQAEAEAIAATLPQSVGQRNHCLWNFARALKGIPQLRDCTAKELRPLVRRWFEQALPIIRTKDFTTTWAEFQQAWKKARQPLGENIVSTCYASALADPLPACAHEYDLPEVQRLVALCAKLQDQFGGEPFFLSTRMAAVVVDSNFKSVARWFRMLEEDGVLQCVKRGTITGRKASEFRFIGAR